MHISALLGGGDMSNNALNVAHIFFSLLPITLHLHPSGHTDHLYEFVAVNNEWKKGRSVSLEEEDEQQHRLEPA